MADDFTQASTAFPNVTFAGVDCVAHPALCEAHDASGYPRLQLFQPNSRIGIRYETTRSLDGFCDFIENYTQFKGKRPPRVFVDVHSLNIDELIEEHTCLLVVYYAPWCSHSKRFLPQGRIAAAAFVGEPNVSIGTLNCDKYHQLCENSDLKGFPTIKLFKNGSIIPFSDRRNADGVISFMNSNCGTERAIGGLLNDEAGLVNETRPIVESFLKAGDKPAEIEKMKKIEGAEFYVKVMERIVAKGEAAVERDLAKMREMLDERKLSWTALDVLKKRSNIFRQFVVKKEKQTTEEKGSGEAQVGL
jgi:protein disulfide-isomerase A6